MHMQLEQAPEQPTKEGQSLKLGSKAAVFKRVSLLIKGAKHANWQWLRFWHEKKIYQQKR